MATVSSLNVQLTMDKGSFDAGLKSAKTSLEDFGKSLTSLGQKLSVGVTAPLALLGKSAIEAASDLNESMSAVQTVFGDAAASVKGFSGSVASELGLSRQEALQAATTFGSLGKSIGYTEEQAATFSNRMTQSAADLASFYNAPVPEALDAIRSGLTGESEPLKRFNIFMSDAALNAYAAAQGLDKTTQEMTEGEKVALRYGFILDHLGEAQGDYARTGGGLANQLRTLNSEWTDLKATLGTVLLPQVLKFVKVIRDAIKWVSDLPPETQKWVVILLAAAAALGPLLIALGTMLPALGAIGGAIAAIASPIGLLIAGIVALVAVVLKATGVWDALGKGIGMFVLLLQKGVHPLDALVGALQEFWSQMGGDPGQITAFVETIRGLWAALQEGITFVRRTVQYFIAAFQEWEAMGFGPITAAIYAFEQTISKVFGPDVAGKVESFINGFLGAFQRIRAAFEQGGIGAAIGQFFVEMWQGIGSAIAGLAQVGAQMVQSLWSAVQANWPRFVDWVMNTALPAVLETLAQFAGRIVPAVVGWVQALVAALQEHWPEIRAWLENTGIPTFIQYLGMLAIAIPALIVKLVQALVEHWPEITNWFQTTGIPAIQAIFAGAAEVFLQIGGTIITGIWNGIKPMWESTIVPFIQGIPNWILSQIYYFWETIKSAGAAIVDGILSGIAENWQKLIDWVTGGINNLIAGIKAQLHIASPSKVMRDIGANMVAGLREGWDSGLSPLGLPDISGVGGINGGAGRGGGRGGDNVIHTHVHLDGKQIAEVVSRHQMGDLRALMAGMA